MNATPPASRGRHAPPREVRVPLQRQRLLRAAAAEFSDHGYAGTSSESISKRAGMSKATFYEHFANKEECMLALFDRATEVVGESMVQAGREAGDEGTQRIHAAMRAFLKGVAEHPEFAQTLLVEIIGAGPRAAARRDQVLQLFADGLDAENAREAGQGHAPRFSSPNDAYGIVGAITELVSRQVRLGQPKNVLDLVPVIDRLIDGVLAASGD
jgi:AcrR family transcriptional regulator